VLHDLPGARITKAYLLHGEALAFSEDRDEGIKLVFKNTLPDENCSVVVLELDKDASGIPVIGK
jgi:alpha-L-fucosidase